MDEATYFNMIGQKTASLIATSCELGAITTTKKDQDRKATYDFGNCLYSQIKDDYLILLVVNIKPEKF